MPSTTRNQRRRQPVRSQQRRSAAVAPSRHLEPPDYSRDYAEVRRDLVAITVISVVLFALMIGLSFVL